MAWFDATGAQLGEAAAKAVLMYGVAVVGLRLGRRRTLAEWTVIDFVAAVAIGAIVGRTAIAGTQSFLVGAVALAAILIVHELANRARFWPPVRRLLDHEVVVLVRHGRLDERALHRAGIPDADLFASLRQQGHFDLKDLRYVLYEGRGGLTVVPEADGDGRPLLEGIVDDGPGPAS